MKENIGTFLEYVAMWHQLGIDYVEESDRKYETPFCQYFWVFFFLQILYTSLILATRFSLSS